MKHINRLRHTNPTCNRDCVDGDASPVLADTFNVVTLMTSATNGNMFFRREDLWFHVSGFEVRTAQSHMQSHKILYSGDRASLYNSTV